MVGIMTITRICYVGALALALTLSGGALAQEGNGQMETDLGDGDQMEMMDDQDMNGTMADDEVMDDAMSEDQDMEESVDPASPEADGMDGTMTDEQDMADEMDEGAAPEDMGPAEMISDSSERALDRAELSGMTCEELWVARNEIFDRNGYCFRSERAQAYFDNSDCTSDSQDILSELEWDNVEVIKSVESSMGCN